MSATLNGWTSARLDDLAADVAEIKKALDDMHSQELADLKADLKEAQTGPRARVTAYLAPLLAALIPTIVILFHHA